MQITLLYLPSSDRMQTHSTFINPHAHGSLLVKTTQLQGPSSHRAEDICSIKFLKKFKNTLQRAMKGVESTYVSSWLKTYGFDGLNAASLGIVLLLCSRWTATLPTGDCVKNILQQQMKSRWLFGLLERLLQSGKNKQRLLFYAQWHHRLTWMHHKCYVSNSLGTKQGKKECEKINMVLHKSLCPLPSAAAPLQFLKELKHTAEAVGTNIYRNL